METVSKSKIKQCHDISNPFNIAKSHFRLNAIDKTNLERCPTQMQIPKIEYVGVKTLVKKINKLCVALVVM